MKHDALNRWTRAAHELANVRSSFAAPMHVLMSEAIGLVRFCRDHWEAVPQGELARPGLCEAVGTLSPSIADELLELEEALHSAHVEYLLTVPPLHAGLRNRAELVLSELVAALEWLLDDGRHEACDEQLALLREAYGPRSTSADALAGKLADYAGLAAQLRPRLAALGSFEMAIIDDAHHLARELGQICRSIAMTGQTACALDLRNRIATLLVDRMTLVRSAAAAVFQDYPAIVRLTTSTFGLRQQASPKRRPEELELAPPKARPYEDQRVP